MCVVCACMCALCAVCIGKTFRRYCFSVEMTVFLYMFETVNKKLRCGRYPHHPSTYPDGTRTLRSGYTLLTLLSTSTMELNLHYYYLQLNFPIISVISATIVAIPSCLRCFAVLSSVLLDNTMACLDCNPIT